MQIRKDILQKFIDLNDKYLIGRRYVEGWGASKGNNESHAVFLSPNICRELWGKNLGELPYDTVYDLSRKEVATNIHLGKSYPPFQLGIYYGDFIDLEEVTCKPNDLIYKCYEDDIQDYYEAIKVMRSFEQDEINRRGKGEV